MTTRRPWLLAAALAACCAAGGAALASDHADTPLLQSVGRHDARLTDLHAFVRGGNLVLALGTNPAIPDGAESYEFPPDVKFRFHIDTDSGVDLLDPVSRASLGGTVLDPRGIDAEIELQVRFDKAGRPRLGLSGVDERQRDRIRLFAGLRDDPFIRIPRAGKNVAAIVIELPLDLVARDRPVLLIWATAKVDALAGGRHEHVGRALRSQFADLDPMNTLEPDSHLDEMGTPPDVLIFDTSRPARFPNGRELTDDVVTDLCELDASAQDCLEPASPEPSENDVPFLHVFPYLAPPHR